MLFLLGRRTHATRILAGERPVFSYAPTVVCRLVSTPSDPSAPAAVSHTVAPQNAFAALTGCLPENLYAANAAPFNRLATSTIATKVLYRWDMPKTGTRQYRFIPLALKIGICSGTSRNITD